MSTRTTLRPYAVMTDGDMSGSLESAPTVLQGLTTFSYSMTWSGSSPVGTVSVEVSNDYSIDASGNTLNAGSWNTLTLAYNGSATTTIPVSGNTGKGFIEIQKTAAYAIRLIYTADTGTGLLNVIATGKVS